MLLVDAENEPPPSPTTSKGYAGDELLIPNAEPSNVKLDSAVAVPSPSDVSTRSLPSLPIALIATVTAANVESPLRNVDELAVPDPNLAVGTVPDPKFDAFKAVSPYPLPVAIPVKNTSPSLLKVIPLPTTIPFLAVTKPTESILVTSS